jgi:tetratricopeptide (TPR) repeat protein
MPTLQEAHLRHAHYYLNLLNDTDQTYRQGGKAIEVGLELLDLEWENIQIGQKWAERYSKSNGAAAEMCSDYPIAGGYILDLRMAPSERIGWLEAALVSARRLQYQEAEGMHIGNLGVAYMDLGETKKAIEFHKQRLAIARDLGDRRGESTVLGNFSKSQI